MKQTAKIFAVILGVFFGLIALLFVAVLVLYALGYSFLSALDPTFKATDTCLDRGGRWNAETLECEYSES